MGLSLGLGLDLGRRGGRAGGGAGAARNALSRPVVSWDEGSILTWINTTADVQGAIPTSKKDTWRASHEWQYDCTDPRVVFANWLIVQDGTGEKRGLPDYTILAASLEYPAGTLYPLTFGGESAVTLANGEFQEADPVPGLSCVAGETFYVRLFAESAGDRIPCRNVTVNAAGQGQSLDGLDHTMDEDDPSTVFVGLSETGDVYFPGPLCVSGTTSATPTPLVVIIGDSQHTIPRTTPVSGYSGSMGYLGDKALASGYRLWSFASSGERMSGFFNNDNNGGSANATPADPVHGSPIRGALCRQLARRQPATVVNAYGTNDHREGISAANWWLYMDRVCRETLAGCRVYLSTIFPWVGVTTSPSPTLAQQFEITAGDFVRRVAYNAHVKNDYADVGALGFFNQGEAVQDAVVTDKWKVGNTDDGTHLTTACADGDAYDAITPVSNFGTLSPVADFSLSPSSGAPPLTVDFTDASSRSPTSWAWYRRVNGTTPWGTAFSTAQNPADVEFAAEASYDIRLVATNAGGSDEEVKLGEITVANVPTLPGSLTSVMAHWCADPAGLYTDTGLTTPAGSGDAVAGIKDLVGSYHATQATSGSRGAATVSGGKWGVSLDGTDDFYSIAGSLTLSGDFEFWFVGNPTSGGSKPFAANSDGAHLEVIGLGQIIPDWVTIYNPSHGSAGTLSFKDATATAGTLRAFGFTRSGATVTFYIGGTSLGTGTVDGALHLADLFKYSTAFFAGPWHEAVVCSAEQSSGARADLLATLAARWGV
jgi:PKD repeat protein